MEHLHQEAVLYERHAQNLLNQAEASQQAASPEQSSNQEEQA
jgi:hypothetical protein